ncbi:MAG TPA: alkaline phosphatase family protein, partial [Polyangia bacterium]
MLFRMTVSARRQRSALAAALLMCALTAAGCVARDDDNDFSDWRVTAPGVSVPPAGPPVDATNGTEPPLPGKPPPARRHVIVLSIDGCRPDALTQARTPNLIRFGLEGARASRAFTIPLSLTLPSHSSMLSGYDMERHGVTWNHSDPLQGYIKVPTIFQVANNAGLRTIMIMGKGKFLTLQLPDTLDEVHEVGGDEEGITEQAIFVIRRRNFDLMFIHFPNPDLVGHAEGWMSAGYLARVAKIDELVGRMMAVLPTNTTMIVTADHGGHDFGHGEDIDIDRRIPWMIRGPGIRRGLVFSRRIETMDTAATALKVLGLGLDVGAQGRPVDEVFLK